MKRVIKFIVLVLYTSIWVSARGQDPSFSQFFSSPLNINPALTANINANWRFISNFRNQWIGPASPYTTGTISYDQKVLEDKVLKSSTFGIGGMVLYDQAMQGALTSTAVSLNTSFNLMVYEGASTHRLGIGIGGIYANKRVDFNKLNFGEQFTGSGFDTNLPTGEAALTNLKPYLSTSVGLLYSITTDNSNIDIGAAAYHLNRPKQSVLENPKQYLAPRYVVHANFETYLTSQLVFNANGIYQRQETASYFSIGGGLGYHLSGDPDDVVLNAGLWYWSKNAVIPYIGMLYQNLQFGLSYDITISKLSQAAERPKTFELSFIIRGIDKEKGSIPCPWK
ncbi:MAG: PorP/SprF family type IX secretion system membrane protein [Chitinophagaceae bacterium]